MTGGCPPERHDGGCCRCDEAVGRGVRGGGGGQPRLGHGVHGGQRAQPLPGGDGHLGPVAGHPLPVGAQVEFVLGDAPLLVALLAHAAVRDRQDERLVHLERVKPDRVKQTKKLIYSN